jgi:SAM-dependent methyltransferase
MSALSMSIADELKTIYDRRFADTAEYRNRVWQVLTASYFNRWVKPNHAVLDLGCGYGEFINNVDAAHKYAMDLNPDARHHLAPNVRFLEQDCSIEWKVPDNSFDVVFTSNFFEHLLSKECLSNTLKQAFRCIRPDGRLIAMGPNIKHIPGSYWDFFDHHIALTEASLGEAREISGFELAQVTSRFLPYTLINAPRYPLMLLKIYIACPLLWRLKGAQFLIVANKPQHGRQQ